MPAAAAALPSAERLRALIAHLETGLLERGDAVRLALLAALAGEHVLLIGPPGTAKSALARRLQHAFDGARYFERLLTRFSVPEELFGPLSLKALEADRYERLTEGYLPTAGIAFLDEVFKANSAILNALLTLLNEREFDNGVARVRTPLVCVVGATNEVPTDEALHAFYDRFLLRVPVQPVGDASFEALLGLAAGEDAAADGGVTRDELAAIAAARDGVALSDDALAALAASRAWLRAQQPPLAVSDRRWRQLAQLLRVQALTEGRSEVDALDLWLLPFVVAAEPAQVPAVARWFAEQVVDAGEQHAPWLAHAVEAFEMQLDIEESLPPDIDDEGAGKQAIARSIGRRDDGGRGYGADATSAGATRLVAAALEDRLRRHYGRVHIDARVAQVDAALARAHAERAPIAARLESLTARLAGRLWLPPELGEALTGALQATLATIDGLLARLNTARAGYAALPHDARLDGAAQPEPVALSA